MDIKQANRTALIEQFALVRTDLRASGYAARQALELLGMSAAALVDTVRGGRAVLLPYTEGAHTYHLIFRPARESFFVAVVSNHVDAFLDGAPHIKDVLTVESFEAQGGEASKRFKRTAAARVLDAVEFRQWDVQTHGEKAGPRSLRVITYYRDAESGEVKHVVFNGARVCPGYIEAHGLENAFGHPGFTDWYKRAAEREGLDLLNVVSLKIADTDKTTLNLSAPAVDCEHCERGRWPVQYSEPHSEESVEQQGSPRPLTLVRKVLHRVFR